jgi:hypothetical protein
MCVYLSNFRHFGLQQTKKFQDKELEKKKYLSKCSLCIVYICQTKLSTPAFIKKGTDDLEILICWISKDENFLGHPVEFNPGQN